MSVFKGRIGKKKPPKKPRKAPPKRLPGDSSESDAEDAGSESEDLLPMPAAPPARKKGKLGGAAAQPATLATGDEEDAPATAKKTPGARPAKRTAGMIDEDGQGPEREVPPPAAKKSRKRKPSIKVDEAHTTGDLLKPEMLNEVRFMIAQFGGRTLNIAGDAALYAARGRNGAAAFVDVGSKGGMQNKRLKTAMQTVLGSRDLDMSLDEAASSEDEWETKLRPMAPEELRILGIITHSHKDHASGNLPIKAENLSELRVGRSGAGKWAAGKVDEAKRKAVTKPRERLLSFREGGKTKQGGNPMRMTSRALLPDAAPDQDDPNALSLGVVTKVERGGAKDGERLFTMYSLGDMEPAEAQGRVQQAFIDDGQRKADVVKMAHHGSDNNVGALPPEVMDEHTVVIFSGFTGLSGPALDDFLARDGYQWKEGYILYEDKQLADEMRNSAFGKRLEESGFKFARDYVVRVTKNGAVEHFATQWNQQGKATQ